MIMVDSARLRARLGPPVLWPGRPLHHADDHGRMSLASGADSARAAETRSGDLIEYLAQPGPFPGWFAAARYDVTMSERVAVPPAADAALPGSGRRNPWRTRRVVIAARLANLHGPTSGVVELPLRLFWQPDRHVDLDSPGLLPWMYETVLREAHSVEELEQWLDGPTLERVWPDLYLPAVVRQAWQQRHPVLRRDAA
jgi:hypothetical protein